MTHFSGLFDPNIKNTCPTYKLLVNGQRLALGKRAGNHLDSNLVGGGVVGSGPHYHVDMDFIMVEAEHPVFTVSWMPIGSGVIRPASFLQLSQYFLLSNDRLLSVDLFRPLSSHC
ncbi:hypothetical protein HanRHA438_Chr17g0822631 [Helianthus annuus]|nr:hypothetical protein HanRHA438_Chr17g0822631 [Helianthus annuus]